MTPLRHRLTAMPPLPKERLLVQQYTLKAPSSRDKVNCPLAQERAPLGGWLQALAKHTEGVAFHADALESTRGVARATTAYY